jgi:1-acyl-sn-glycerol-3-phosphate acyltransferase
MNSLKTGITNTFVILLIGALACFFLGVVPGAAAGALIGLLFHATVYGATIGAAIFSLVVAWRTAYWYVQGFRLQTIGYIPPGPSTLERIIYVRLCRGILRLALGPIKFIGSENAHYEGRLAVTPNHQHGFDFLVARVAVPFAFRQIGAAKEVKGWRSGLAAFAGTFAVPVMGGKATDHNAGELVILNCAKMLVQSPRRRMLMFVQGKLVYDNVLRPEDFRTGNIRMLHKVHELTNEDPADLPIAIHYWERCDCLKPTLFRRSMVWLFTKLFPDYGSGPKYGATVVIGKPIPLSTLPEDPRAAIEQVRVAMDGLLDIAKANTPARAKTK